MGLFTEDPKLELVPRTAGSLAGEAYLTNLIGQNPTIPTQNVAGLTPIQQAIMRSLSDSIGGITGAADTASNYYKGILSDNYDVFSDPRYQALKVQAGENARAAETATKRGGEALGMLNSSPVKQEVYKNVAATQSPLLAAIGDLITNRENQKMQAAQGIQSAEANKINELAGVTNIADLQRVIEQQQNDALFNQILQQILFPYQYQANLANALMNYTQPYAVTGGGLTDLGFGASLAAPIVGGLLGGPLGAMAGAGAGAGINAGVSPSPSVYPTFNDFRNAGPYG